MIFKEKSGITRRRAPIIQTATQPLTDFLISRGAGGRQRKPPSKTTILNSRRRPLRPEAGCGGSGLMTANKHLDNFLAALAFTFTLGAHRLAAALLLMMGIVISPALIAGELDEPNPLSSTGQMALHMPSPEPSDLTVQPSQFEFLEQRRLLRAEKEAKIQAQTQYLASKFPESESKIRKYVELAWNEASKRNGVPAELLIAMMQKESSLRSKVESHYGAQGLMQVVRRWHHDKLNHSESLFDPAVNIRVGADVLEEYLEEAGGSLNKALKKYSGNAQGYATKVLNESYKLARVAAEAAGEVLASKG